MKITKKLALEILSLPPSLQPYPMGGVLASWRQSALEQMTGTKPPKAKAGVNIYQKTLFSLLCLDKNVSCQADLEKRAIDKLKEIAAGGDVEKAQSIEEMKFDDSRKNQSELDKGKRIEQMAELQAQPLTAPQIDHPELFAASLADQNGQKSLF